MCARRRGAGRRRPRLRERDQHVAHAAGFRAAGRAVGVTESGFIARLSDAGKRHPVTRGLTARSDPPHWSRFFRLVDTRNVTGSAVMEGARRQAAAGAVAHGEGRVALLLSDHIWLWARGYEGGGPHLDLLRRLSHWLMKQPELEEEALRLSVAGATSLSAADDGGQRRARHCHLTRRDAQSDARRRRARPVARHDPNADELGLWQASDGKLTALINVGPCQSEGILEVTSTTDVLSRWRRRAAATRGASFDGGSLAPAAHHSGALASVFQRRRLARREDARRQRRARHRRAADLFAGLIGLLLLIGAFAATWLREGR
jgi:hypothetical protein